MTRQVFQTTAALTSRFLRLAQVFNDELGFRDQRLRFGMSDDRTGVTIWKLQNAVRTPDEERTLPDMAATLETASDDGALLAFAFTEHWVRRRADYAFKSSNLRFAIMSTDPGAQALQFRLEWAGLETVGSKLVFPGKGAAHPHWQFDGELRSQPLQPAITIAPETIDISLEPEVAIVDLEALEGPGEPEAPAQLATDVVGPLPWFHKLHLPARAMWSESECRMPEEATAQQHSPGDVDDLDRWVVSALRYLRHEFSTYSY